MDEIKEKEGEPGKEHPEAPLPPGPYPMPYPPLPYPPPPPPQEAGEPPTPKERERILQLKAILVLSIAISVIAILSFITGLIYFNMGLDVEAGGFRSLDTLRGVLLMGLSGLFLFGMYTFIILNVRRDISQGEGK